MIKNILKKIINFFKAVPCNNGYTPLLAPKNPKPPTTPGSGLKQ